MKKLAIAGFALATLAACSKAPDAGAEADAAKPAPESASTNDDGPKYTRQDVPGSVEGREVAEVTLDELRAPFTEETVQKLNAIVRRGQEASHAFIDSVKDIRADVEAAAVSGASDAQKEKARARLEELRSLNVVAEEAVSRMDDAVAELEASEESYSEELLAGMVKYVHDVRAMITGEIAVLEGRLNDAS